MHGLGMPLNRYAFITSTRLKTSWEYQVSLAMFTHGMKKLLRIPTETHGKADR